MAPTWSTCAALVGYWKGSFDWRAQEAALNTYPRFKVRLHDIDVHYLHVPDGFSARWMVLPTWNRDRKKMLEPIIPGAGALLSGAY